MKTYDLTRGNILRSLLLFSLPILFSNFFQQLYNTVDTMIVSHYLGATGLAMIGASSAIYELCIGFTSGVGNGFAVLVARYFGSKDMPMLKKCVACAIVLNVVLAIAIMVLSCLVLKSLLVYLDTPEEILAEAYRYIFIILFCVGVTIAFNTCAGMLRAISDAVTPLIALVLSSVTNILLDILFIYTLKLGIQGAAYATVLAQALATVFCLFQIKRKHRLLVPNKASFAFAKSLYLEMSMQGLSMGLMMSIVSLGSLILQKGINGFGTNVIAGHTSARKISSLFNMPLQTLSVAMTTFASQNKGAGQYERIKAGVKDSIKLSSLWSLVSLLLVLCGANYLVVWITGSTNQEVIQTATMYLRINIPFYFILGPLSILRCVLQGLGKKIVPLVSSFIELLGKVIFVMFMIPVLGYLGVCMCEPTTWIIMLAQVYLTYRKAMKQQAV